MIYFIQEEISFPRLLLRQSDLINAEAPCTQDAAELLVVGMGYIYRIISEKGKCQHDKNGKRSRATCCQEMGLLPYAKPGSGF